MALSAYPWGALEPVSRPAARVAAGARQALRSSARQLGQTLSELLELPCELVVKRSQLGRAPTLAQLVWVGQGTLALGLLAEPQLAAFLASRVLRRAEPLSDPREPLPAPLQGLLAALAVEAARRNGAALSLLATPPEGEEALLVEAAVLLEGRAFSLVAYVVGASSQAGPEPTLSRLGALPLRIPLVIASIALERQALLSLEVGGAVLAHEAAGFAERGTLVAPASERGIGVELRPDGRLVVGEATEARLTVEPERTSTPEGETLTDALLDTPVVVRVELGAVSMTAREWARLGPGDVIETAQRIAEPVVLRIAGREVGRGELVNVDGQVGVRIQKLNEAT